VDIKRNYSEKEESLEGVKGRRIKEGLEAVKRKGKRRGQKKRKKKTR